MLVPKSGKQPPFFTSGRILVVLLTLAMVATTVAFHSTSTATLKRENGGKTQGGRGTPDRPEAMLKPAGFGSLTALLLPAAPPPPATLATYDSTCATAKTTFDLGETVCLKTTGATVGSPA